MKKYLKYMITVVFIGMLLLPIQADAAGTEAFQVEESGVVTVVSSQAATDGACSLQFSLEVTSADAETIEFRFQDSKAKVQEFRYDQDTRLLNIYIAGTETLFANGTDTLTLGTVAVLDRNGGNAAATVSVVTDSFAYVYGTELKTVDNMVFPGAVQLGAGAQPAPTPQPTQKPTDSGNSQGGDNSSQGNNNGSQGSNNNSSQGNNNNGSQGTNDNTQINNNPPQGNNTSIPGSHNNSQGNHSSSQGNGGSSLNRPDSSQEDDDNLKEEDNSSQSSGVPEEDRTPDTVPEIGEDQSSSTWDPSKETEDLTQKETDAAKGVLMLVVIAALVIVAAIAAGAVVLYRKQSRDRRKSDK